MSYWRVYYHLVWATRGRERLIDDAWEVVIRRAVKAKCRELEVIFHGMGIMPDHAHVVVSIPPRLAVAQVVQQLKGSTSYLLNHAESAESRKPFAWQSEYGVLSFGERSLDPIMAYVNNQTNHHANDHLWPSFEMTEKPRPAQVVPEVSRG